MPALLLSIIFADLCSPIDMTCKLRYDSARWLTGLSLFLITSQILPMTVSPECAEVLLLGHTILHSLHQHLKVEMSPLNFTFRHYARRSQALEVLQGRPRCGHQKPASAVA